MASPLSAKLAFSSNLPCSSDGNFRPSTNFWSGSCRLIRAEAKNWSDDSNHKLVNVAANHGKLRLFIDAADKDVWKKWLPTGVFHGVTTNPLLLERAEVCCQVRPLKKLTQRALALGAKEVQLQAWGPSVGDVYQIGSELAEIDTAVVVKIPITAVGLAAAAKLINAGARVTMTGLFSTHQALLAAGVGAEYAAPDLNRMILKEKDGVKDIQEMQRLLTGVGSQLRVLVASIKTVDQVVALAGKGISSYTLAPSLLEQLLVDGDTEEAAQEFDKAASRNQHRLFL